MSARGSTRALSWLALFTNRSAIYEQGARELEGIGVALLSSADVITAIRELAPEAHARSAR
jgi:hypothetical protein